METQASPRTAANVLKSERVGTSMWSIRFFARLRPIRLDNCQLRGITPFVSRKSGRPDVRDRCSNFIGHIGADRQPEFLRLRSNRVVVRPRPGRKLFSELFRLAGAKGVTQR